MPTFEETLEWGQTRLGDLLERAREAWMFFAHEAPGWWASLLAVVQSAVPALGGVVVWLWMALQAWVAWTGRLVTSVRDGLPVLNAKLDEQARAGVETLHLSAQWLAGQFDLGGAIVLPLAVAQGALIGMLLGAVGLAVVWTLRTRGVVVLLLVVGAGVVFASTHLAP